MIEEQTRQVAVELCQVMALNPSFHGNFGVACYELGVSLDGQEADLARHALWAVPQDKQGDSDEEWWGEAAARLATGWEPES